MNNDAIRSKAATWLREQYQWDLRLSLFGGLGLIFCGIVVYGFTLLLIWMPFYVVFGPQIAQWVCLAAIPILFWGNLKTDPNYLQSLAFVTGTFSDQVVVTSHGSTVNPLAPESAHSILKICISVLFQGPRLLLRAWALLSRYRRLKHLDLAPCIELVAYLALQPGRVSLVQLGKGVSITVPKETIDLLANLRVLQQLSKPEPSIILTEAARTEITSTQQIP